MTATASKEFEFAKRVFLRKAIDWKYEREWRYIDFALDGGRRFGSPGFPERFLTGVILVCKKDASEMLELLELARNRPDPFVVYQAVSSSGQFELVDREPHWL